MSYAGGKFDVGIGNGGSSPSIPPGVAAPVSISLTNGPAAFDTSVGMGGTIGRDTFFAPRCTFAFVVRDGYAPHTPAVTTAGHCDFIASLDHNDGTPVNPTSFQDEHRGSQGDFEWHTTSYSDQPVYYARNNETRQQDGTKGHFSINDSTCRYGRVSNVRQCTDVTRVNGTARVDGYTVRHLVFAATGAGVQGDSGGPWSLGAEAHGIHKGGAPTIWSSAVRGTFSRVRRMEDELEVYVWEQ